MIQGEALKQFKEEQKATTAERIKNAIIEIKQNKKLKLSVSNIAKLSGVSRANIYANYKDLIDDFAKVDLDKETDNQKIVMDKNLIEENKLLRRQIKELQEDRKQLIDKIVALKVINSRQNKLSDSHRSFQSIYK